MDKADLTPKQFVERFKDTFIKLGPRAKPVLEALYFDCLQEEKKSKDIAEEAERKKIPWTKSIRAAAIEVRDNFRRDGEKMSAACRRFAATHVLVDRETGKRTAFNPKNLEKYADKVTRKVG